MDEKKLKEKIDRVYRYWIQRLEKCNLKEASLKRQLKELNVDTVDWEECYQLLVNVQDERDSLFIPLWRARVCYSEKSPLMPDKAPTLKERLESTGNYVWLEQCYNNITQE